MKATLPWRTKHQATGFTSQALRQTLRWTQEILSGGEIRQRGNTVETLVQALLICHLLYPQHINRFKGKQERKKQL